MWDPLISGSSTAPTTSPGALTPRRAFCFGWPGGRRCALAGRVTKLALEGLNLTGPLTAALLAPLAELRILSLTAATLAQLHRITIIVLSGNCLMGEIPSSLAIVPRLTSFLLDPSLGVDEDACANLPCMPPPMKAAPTTPAPASAGPTIARLKLACLPPPPSLPPPCLDAGRPHAAAEAGTGGGSGRWGCRRGAVEEPERAPWSR